MKRKIAAMLLMAIMIFTLATTVLAAEVNTAPDAATAEQTADTQDGSNAKAYSAAIAIGLSAAGGVGLGIAAAFSLESFLCSSRLGRSSGLRCKNGGGEGKDHNGKQEHGCNFSVRFHRFILQFKSKNQLSETSP